MPTATSVASAAPIGAKWKAGNALADGTRTEGAAGRTSLTHSGRGTEKARVNPTGNARVAIGVDVFARFAVQIQRWGPAF
jgi:hypothetical protein